MPFCVSFLKIEFCTIFHLKSIQGVLPMRAQKADYRSSASKKFIAKQIYVLGGYLHYEKNK